MVPDETKMYDTAYFLGKIIPTNGVLQLTTIGARGAKNHQCSDISGMITMLKRFDCSDSNVYHACASYSDESSRKADNAKSMKAFWVDVDCGEEKAASGDGYATKDLARSALKDFCSDSGLPSPMIVDSGGGFHVYWPLKAPVTAADWLPVAKKLKRLCSQKGFLADPSRTADRASILRPVGFLNKKEEYSSPRRVALVEDANCIDFAEFSAAVNAATVPAYPAGLRQDSSRVSQMSAENPLLGYVEPTVVAKGGRNDAVLRFAGSLRGKGTPESLILGLTQNFNEAKCKPPLEDEEVRRIVSSYSSQGNPDPDDWPEPTQLESTLPDAPSFNFDMLPDKFVDFVRDTSERMGVPPDYIAVPMMLSAAAALGSGWVICPKANDKGWKETAVLWGGIVAPPGSKKSPCLQLAAKPLQRIEAKLNEAHIKAKDKYQLAKKVAQSDKTNALMLAEPKAERATVQDVTYQKLAEICSSSPKGLMAQWDEVAGMVSAWNTNGQEAARGFYLSAWSGDQPYTVDRKDGGTTRIERLFIVISGGVQPSVLGALVRDAKQNGASNDGLIQRFQMMVYPDPNSAPDEVDRAMDEVAQQHACDAVERLRDLTAATAKVEEEQKSGRAVLHFKADAQSAFNQVRRRTEQKVKNPQTEPLLAAHFAKMPGAIAKLAMLIHLMDAGQGNVTLAAVKKAIHWSVYLKGHAERVYALWQASNSEAASRILQGIKDGKLADGFTSYDLKRKGWSGLKDIACVEDALSDLVTAGWLRAASPSGNEIGRPTVRYLINPKASAG